MNEKTRSWFGKIGPEDLIYYTRIIFAIVAASVCLIFNLSGPLGIIGFIIGVALIVSSYLLPLYLLGIDPESIGGHVRGLMKGLGTGILLFIVIWFIIFNFLVFIA